MLRCASFFLMVLQLVSLPANADPTIPKGLEIVEQTLWVKSLETLRTACDRTDPIRACTRFSGALIPGPCIADGMGWSLKTPAIRIVALRILLGPSRESFDDGTVRHENHHLIDFREQLSDYLDGLGNRVFVSQPQCRSAADLEMAGFSSRMNEIARLSNRRRHR